jgi:two-component system cell cycle sensor histidine kinase/response regulator CckA
MERVGYARLPSTMAPARWWPVYAQTVAVSAMGVIVALVIGSGRGHSPPMTVPLLAVIASAYLGGLWTGLLSTAVVGLGTSVFFFQGPGVAQQQDVDRWLAAFIAGVLVSIASEAMQRRTRRHLRAREAAEAALHAELSAREARAREAQHQSEQRFTQTFHASPGPMCITHVASGRYVEANDAYLAMCGCTRDELIGATSAELGLLDAGEREDIIGRTRRGGLRARRVTLHARNGGDRTILTNTEMIDLDREPHLLVTAIDVTDLMRAEAAAREGDQRFRQVSEVIREVFYLYDREQQRMLYVSPAYEAIWGRTASALYGSASDWIEAVHPADREGVRAWYAAASPRPHTECYRIVAPDGTVRWIEDRVCPVLDERGEVVRIAGVADDVTERRRLEEELRHSQKMESIGALAGGVAHDFNNILTVILSCVEALSDDASPDARELIDDMLAAVARATALTRQLLVFSRREVVEPRVLDLNAAVADTEKMLRRLIGEDVVLATAPAPSLGRVRIDPVHLLQAIMNLVVNARDAMPRGGRLTITTRNVGLDESVATLLGSLPPGRYAMLAVTDTGCGMSPEVQSRVFEPFFTTKPAGQGTGMGLAVTHGIVQQAGGLIDLQSTPGVGTTFAIYLPCVTDDACAAAPARAAIVRRGDETVLLVEDADDVRRSTARVLEAQGYQVLQASRGVDGLALLERHAGVKLLITDVVMPAMDGRQLAEAAARIAPALRVLYTSGYTDDAVVRHGVERNQVAFLQKPFPADALVRKVREVLDRAAA